LSRNWGISKLKYHEHDNTIDNIICKYLIRLNTINIMILGQKCFYSREHQFIKILRPCLISDTTVFMSSRNEKNQTIKFVIIQLIQYLESVQSESIQHTKFHKTIECYLRIWRVKLKYITNKLHGYNHASVISITLLSN